MNLRKGPFFGFTEVNRELDIPRIFDVELSTRPQKFPVIRR